MAYFAVDKAMNRLAFVSSALTFLSVAFGCEAQNGTDDCSDAACGPQGSTGGRVASGGTSSGGQSPGGGSASGGHVTSSGGSAGEGNGAEERIREACLSGDPNAEFWLDESGCWVCQHEAELEPQELVFEDPQCFDYGFQLRKVELGCGYIWTSWLGDADDSSSRIYALTEPSDGLGGAGGATEPHLGPYTATLIARGGQSNGVCSYELYGETELPSCDASEQVCPETD